MRASSASIRANWTVVIVDDPDFDIVDFYLIPDGYILISLSSSVGGSPVVEFKDEGGVWVSQVTEVGTLQDPGTSPTGLTSLVVGDGVNVRLKGAVLDNAVVRMYFAILEASA